MRVVPALVAYCSADWIQVAITSYLHHFPGDRVLVVDNNPTRGDLGWTPDCERERRWLLAHERVIYVKNPRVPCPRHGDRPHGLGMDQALAWARERGADVLLHFEPDCQVLGTRWRENLLEALDRGAWMAGSHRSVYGPIHPTPSAWRIDSVRTSFSGQERAEDSRHDRYHELLDMRRLEAEVTPRGDWWWWQKYWDTGEKAWFDAALEGRAAQVETPDFHHYWNGSKSGRPGRSALIRLHPELATWFHAAESTARRRRPEDCEFRGNVRGEGARQIARCGLLAGITGLADGAACDVRRDACEACSAAFRPSEEEPNPVVASLLFALGQRLLAAGGIDGVDATKAGRLAEWAEAHLDYRWEEPAPSLPEHCAETCVHFAEPIGSRPVATPQGHDRIVVHRCGHENHSETTPEECLSCRDWSDRPDCEPASLSALLPAPARRYGPPVRTWAVGVLTAPRREPTLDRLLDSLNRAGWERPRLFVDGSTTIAERHADLPLTLREPRIGAWPNFALALAELLLREPEADAFLMIEDDALFYDREDLRTHLERDVLWPVEGVGAVSLYCSSVDTHPQPGWHVFPGAWVWGALALIFPRESARLFLADPLVLDHRNRNGAGLADTDALVGRWSSLRGRPIVFPTPSLVQHIGETSALWPAIRAQGFRRADRFAGSPDPARP